MANTHIRRCLTLLFSREMKIQTALWYQGKLIRITKIEYMTILSIRKNVGQLEHSCTSGIFLATSSTVKHFLDQAGPLQDTYFKKMIYVYNINVKGCL